MSASDRIDTGQLSRMLVYAAEQTKSHFAAAVAPHSVSVPAARALLGISNATPMRELARHLAVDPSYLTGLADELEKAGLLVRTVGDDRRVKLLELTAEGQSMRSRLAASVAADEPLSVRLDNADREALAAILGRLLDQS